MAEHSDLQTIRITEADQAKPALNKTHPRLYGHALCPFVEATRLTLAAKQVVYQFVELDLSKKTQWHLDINGGLVPILEFPNGTIILESKIIQELANDLQKDQGLRLFPEDPIEKAELQLAITKTQGAFIPQHHLQLNHGVGEENIEKLSAVLNKIEDGLVKNSPDHPYFWNTPEPTQLDLVLYPWLARILALENSVFDFLYKRLDVDAKYPRIIQFVNTLRTREDLQVAFSQLEPYQAYLAAQFEQPDGQK